MNFTPGPRFGVSRNLRTMRPWIADTLNLPDREAGLVRKRQGKRCRRGADLAESRLHVSEGTFLNRSRKDSSTSESAPRGAFRFYWCWLVTATGVSILGNITHALLVAPDNLRVLAAIASVVPPIFVLGSTHSVALGLTKRRLALVHTMGLIMTSGVAACAFLLSFNALANLAVLLGWPTATAWLFPIVIDVSIAQATFGLLSMSSLGVRVAADLSTAHGRSPRMPRVRSSDRDRAAVDGSRPRRLSTTTEAAERPGSPPAAIAPRAKGVDLFTTHTGAMPVDASELLRWERTAHELIRNGTTSKDPKIVAAILAEYATGIAPSTISRRRKVHHSTVGRILEGALALAGQPSTSREPSLA